MVSPIYGLASNIWFSQFCPLVGEIRTVFWSAPPTLGRPLYYFILGNICSYRVVIHIFVAHFGFNCKVWLSLAFLLQLCCFLCEFCFLCFGLWFRLLWTWTEPGEPVRGGPVQGSKNFLNRTPSPVRSSQNFVKNRTKPDHSITIWAAHLIGMYSDHFLPWGISLHNSLDVFNTFYINK